MSKEEIERYTQIIDNPNSTDEEKAMAYGSRGIAYFQQEQHPEAIADYTQAIKLYIDNNGKANAYNNRGNIYGQQGEYSKAIEDYTQAIEQYTNNKLKTNTYYNRGIAYNKQGEYDPAIGDYTKIINQKCVDEGIKVRAWNNRADIYSKQGEYKQAIDDFTEALNLFEKNPIIIDKNMGALLYANRGLAYAKRKDYTQAIADFDKIIQLNPNHKLKYLQQGIDSFNRKDYRTAIDNLNKALRYGVSSENIATYKVKAFPKDNKESSKEDNIANNIFAIFESVHQILDKLKVSKDPKDKAKDDSKDKVKYLSHTTKLSVFTKFLVPVRSEGEPELGKLRMYHIAYANDPTEGTVLLKHLGIAPEQIEAGANIPYVMVASFCGGEDIKALDSLPMWSMYGDNAQGIALLFQTKDLAYSEPGHVGYSQQAQAMSNFKSTISKEDGNNSLENKEVSSVLQDKKSTEKETPPQILYRVHYLGSDNEIVNDNIAKIKTNLKQIEEKQQQTMDIHNKILELLNVKNDLSIDELRENIKKFLAEIKKKQQQTMDIHDKILESLNVTDDLDIDGLRENIKAILKQIPDIYHKCLELLNGIRYLIKDKSYAYEQEYRLVCFAGTEHIPEILKSEAPTEQDQEQKDIPTKSVPYIYIETDKLDKLCAVITAPKASKAEQLYINYLLQLYKKSNKLLRLEEPAIHKSIVPYR